MANLDPNGWYQVTVASAKGESMFGTTLYDNGMAGAVFFKSPDLSKGNFLWQFFPYDSSRYVLRCREGNVNALLAARFSDKEDTPGSTVPYLVRNNVSDDSVIWSIGPWGDSSFHFSNAQNGSDWQMNRKGNTLMAMTSNITGEQPGQQFSFAKVSAINNNAWSTLVTSQTTINLRGSSASTTTPAAKSASATASTSTTAIADTAATSAPTSSSTSSESRPSSSRISTGVAAGIGVSFGVVALTAVIFAFLFFRRRRKQTQAGNAPPTYEVGETTPEMMPTQKYEMYAERGPSTSTTTYELTDSTAPVELGDTAVLKK